MENSAHKETHDSVVEEDLELNKLEDDLALIENAMEKIDQEDLKAVSYTHLTLPTKA